jgi:hypothetical protein
MRFVILHKSLCIDILPFRREYTCGMARGEDRFELLGDEEAQVKRKRDKKEKKEKKRKKRKGKEGSSCCCQLCRAFTCLLGCVCYPCKEFAKFFVCFFLAILIVIGLIVGGIIWAVESGEVERQADNLADDLVHKYLGQ